MLSRFERMTLLGSANDHLEALGTANRFERLEHFGELDIILEKLGAGSAPPAPVVEPEPELSDDELIIAEYDRLKQVADDFNDEIQIVSEDQKQANGLVSESLRVDPEYRRLLTNYDKANKAAKAWFSANRKLLTRMSKDRILAKRKASQEKYEQSQINTTESASDGRVAFVNTPTGDKVETAFRVIEVDDLIISNTLDGRVNPEYPQNLQPRDRTRKTSMLQIEKIAGDLQPEQLTDSGLTSQGAPIIGLDRVVESGNGRTLAIAKAYQAGNAKGYKQYIVENAALYGLKSTVVLGMKEPVLVRVRKTEMDRAKFTRDSNRSDLQAMSAAETAWVDAETISRDMMQMFRPADNGNLLTRDNQHFVDKFMSEVGSAGAAGLYTSDGKPTKQMVDRLQNAIFAKAYKSEKLVKLVAEETDPEIRNVLHALNFAAADFVTMQELDGRAHDSVTTNMIDRIDDYSKTDVSERTGLAAEALESLIKATELVREAKATGQTIDAVISQQDMFSDSDPAGEALAAFISANNRSAKRLAFGFKALAQGINKELEHKAASIGDMFGGGDLTLIDVITSVNQEIINEFGNDANTIDIDRINIQAGAGASGADNDNAEPSEKQKEAGNYKKGRLNIAGLDIVIENAKGSNRSGTDDNGESWSVTMQHHYGDIKGTIGADGDKLDVFIGDNLDAEKVFIIDQIEPKTRKFDEHKIMMGFNSVQAARKAYFANYSDGWAGLGAIKVYSIDKFKQWLESGNTRIAVKYKEGALSELKKPELTGGLNPMNYIKHSAIELKTAMLKASDKGATLENIASVYDGWLTANPQIQANA